MANAYYDHSTFPSSGAAGSSAAMRAELDAIEAGFDKLPVLSGNGLKLVRVNSGGTALEAADASAGAIAYTPTGNTSSTNVQSAITELQGDIDTLGTSKQSVDSDLTAIAGLATNGLISRTGTGTMATRTLTAPAAGVSVTNGDGVAGNPTLALANDLAAVEGLSGIGIVRRTATDTWSVGTAVALASEVSGTLPFGNGGTGQTSYTDGQLLIGNTATGGLSKATITAGSGISITNGNGTITINNSLGGGGTVSSVGLTVPSGFTVTGSPVTTSGTLAISGTLNPSAGGTGNATYAVGDILYASGTTTLSRLADVAAGNVIISGGVGGAPAYGKVGLSTHCTGTLDLGSQVTNLLPAGNGGTGNAFFGVAGPVTSVKTYTFPNASCNILTTNAAVTAPQGGTGQTSFTAGDLLQATGSSAIGLLAAVASGNVLLSGGVGVVSSWGKVGLTTHVSGTLPIANGGTNLTASGSAGKVLTSNGSSFSMEYSVVKQNGQSGNYTLALSDSSGHVYGTNAGAQTITVPTNASVAFPIGTAITIINNGTTSIGFSTSGVTMYTAGIAGAWSVEGSLGVCGMCTLLKVDTDTWFISGPGLA